MRAETAKPRMRGQRRLVDRRGDGRRHGIEVEMKGEVRCICRDIGTQDRDIHSSLAGRLSEAGRVVLYRSGMERERSTAK